MSLNALPMKIVQSLDEVMAFKQEREFAVYDGGSEISYVQFPAQGPSNSNITITCNPPDEKTVIDPRITVTAVYKLQFTGVGTGGGAGPLLVPGVYDAPRSFPLANTTNTVELKVNGTSFNTNLNEYFSTINRTGMYSRDLNQEFSLTPSMLDLSQNYTELVNSSRNPLAGYLDSTPYVQGRGAGFSTTDPNAMVYVQSNVAGAGTAVVYLKVTEPVFLSPFYPSKSGFGGIKTMTANFTFSDLRRVWSHGVDGVNSGTITNLVVDITAFQMNFRYITPKDLTVIPKQMCWPYHEFLVTSSPVGVLNPGQSINGFSMGAINLEAHPQRLLYVIREQDTDLFSGPGIISKTDTYARIDGITVSYANSQGKLASASTADLYDIYVKNSNGSLSFVEWTQKVGSVLPIDVGRDIGLNNLSAPSKLDNPQLSTKLNITNISDRPINYMAFCFVIYEGTACLNHGMITKSIAVLTSSDVLESQQSAVTLVHHEPTNMYGGSFFSTLKNAFVKGRDFAKKHKLISKGLSMFDNPLAQDASHMAAKYGYGMRAGALVTRPPYYEDQEGLTHKGGRRKVSRKSLKRRGGALVAPSDSESEEQIYE